MMHPTGEPVARQGLFDTTGVVGHGLKNLDVLTPETQPGAGKEANVTADVEQRAELARLRGAKQCFAGITYYVSVS